MFRPPSREVDEVERRRRENNEDGVKQRNNILEMVQPAILQPPPFHRFRHPPLLARVFRPEERILTTGIFLCYFFTGSCAIKNTGSRGMASHLESTTSTDLLFSLALSLFLPARKSSFPVPLRLKRVSLTCPLPILYIYKGNRYFFEHVSACYVVLINSSSMRDHLNKCFEQRTIKNLRRNFY